MWPYIYYVILFDTWMIHVYIALTLLWLCKHKFDMMKCITGAMRGALDMIGRCMRCNWMELTALGIWGGDSGHTEFIGRSSRCSSSTLFQTNLNPFSAPSEKTLKSQCCTMLWVCRFESLVRATTPLLLLHRPSRWEQLRWKDNDINLWCTFFLSKWHWEFGNLRSLFERQLFTSWQNLG